MFMKRIVFVMTGATKTLGGIASANRNVLCALLELAEDARRQFYVMCLSEEDADRPPFLPVDVQFRGFGGERARFSLALICSFTPNTLYIFDHVRLALPLSPFMALGFRNCVIMAHGSESWRRIRPSSRWLFRRARLCLTNSRFTLKKMRETFAGFNGVDCRLGLSPEYKLSEKLPEPTGEPLMLRSVDGVERKIGDRMFLLVGRMDSAEREKGHTQLLDIWYKVMTKYSTAQLVFAGPGNDRDQLCFQARRIGIADSVFIPGERPTDAMQKLYRKCYAFVMPSKQEGFGLVYLEAMNYAKPCIGCFDNGSEDVILDGKTGFLIHNPDDREELEGAIERLLESESESYILGVQGWKRLHEHFTARHAQQRMVERLTPLL